MENSASGQIQQEANSSIKNEKENTEIQEESRTSSGNENQNGRLVNNIDTETLFTTCLIYKVPYHLRKWNEEAYTPQVISIGPYHNDKEKFQTMEKHKERYFRRFMKRAEINLEDFVSTIREMEDRIRCCYVETVPFDSDDFVRMIRLDAIFILELFLTSYYKTFPSNDPMLVEDWLLSIVEKELVLLEHQVPFFVIDELYNLALPSKSDSVSLTELTFKFFKDFNIHEKPQNVTIEHFTDLLRFFQLPNDNDLPSRGPEMIFPRCSATQLREAGVEFKVSLNKCIPDLNFKNGVLEIPRLNFFDDTERQVRNIMALEQCHQRKPLYCTDFYLLLDCLINTTKDVDLLCDKGIVVNSLSDNNVVTSIINSRNRGIIRSDMNTVYYPLCEHLKGFYERTWNRWKALLRHQYFSSSWRSASTIAAIILLVLTLIQTKFSIIK
ncbi:hypothetical protein ACB098_01G370800 [Castanea mollissima]|uniref:Uncharacterized protein n=1 Tax=Castanea mollissima TaxID=60419 RepID=A0A8J4RAX1_9ROSI|nr:hypothetical protein CMV_015261 [Castanea mollissima]